MASISKRVPIYKVVKAWDDNDLSEVYKLQSNNPQIKVALKSIRLMVNMVLSLPSVRQSLSLIKGLKYVTSHGQTPLWSLKMYSRAIIEWPGKRSFMSTLQSPSMQCASVVYARL
jgi:hypothetical protein